uniref:Protein kinase domain-containing protein n=1 Tax=Heligmosomoides polygyrus TaxID=6339 RepID=A0A183G0U8_HELPZ
LVVHFHLCAYVCARINGLEYCHAAGFLHRDIKCSNILLNNRGELKIADFERLYTNRVITLWYRPPELLLGDEHYVTKSPWFRCILGEFFTRKPLFQGNNEQGDVIQVCGTPSTANWPDVEKMPLYNTLRSQCSPGNPYVSRIVPAGAVDLMDKMLLLDPKRRISAKEYDRRRSSPANGYVPSTAVNPTKLEGNLRFFSVVKLAVRS